MVDQQEIQQRLQRVVAKAVEGNPDAQYALAVYYSRYDLESSLEWMHKAIDQGHAGAIYTLGGWYVQGTLLDQDIEGGIELLHKASNMNFADADLLLASLAANGIGLEKGWKQGLALVTNRARGGYGRALSQLAFLLYMTGDDKAREEGNTLLKAAAERLDMIAMYALAKRVLDSSAKGEERDRALVLMALAARQGMHPLAMRTPGVAGVVVPDPLPKPLTDLDAPDWALIEAILSEPPVPEIPSPKVLKEDPHIATFPGFLTPEESDYMIGMSLRYLSPSQVIDPITGKHIKNQYRSSSDMRFWPSFQDLVIYCFNKRIAAASGEPMCNQELLGVLRYEPGQEYKPHGDYLTADFSGRNLEVETSGQRIKTFLVYLNEDFNGGETEFVNIGLKTRGHKGDGLMFVNITARGEPNTLTVHAGRPVTDGIKWLSTMWIRAKEYKFIKPPKP